MCKTLRVLKVRANNASYMHYPSATEWFPSLKFLNGTAELCCYCPGLVDLTIEKEIMDEDNNFNLYAPELQTLSISLGGQAYNLKFCINAPKLETLNLKGAVAESYSFEAPKSLVNVSIDLCTQAFSPNCAISLCAGISNVKCLSLSAHCVEVSTNSCSFCAIFGRENYRMKEII